MNGKSIAQALDRAPFVPHPALRNAHAQTIYSTLRGRQIKLLNERNETRLFAIEVGSMLARCSWQEDRRSRPTLVLVHGMEGSTDSKYMLGTAEKALTAGLNVVRLNLRNCGNTHHLTPALYHAGLTEDVRRVVFELNRRDGLDRIFLAGFSLGGNIVLKLAGELGAHSPEFLKGVIAISPSLDLHSCADAIELRSNLLYRLSFIMSLRKNLIRKASLYPATYDASRLKGIWSIREFDDVYTAPMSGFKDVNDYYSRASALPYIRRIHSPTCIIHARDDPFIPFTPFTSPEISENANVGLIAPSNGGHVGFVTSGEGDARFWAERRIVEFVAIAGGD